MQANDLDREDFFQIHTYLSYFQNHKDKEKIVHYYAESEQAFKNRMEKYLD